MKWLKRLFKKESKQDVYLRKINDVIELCNVLENKVKIK